LGEELEEINPELEEVRCGTEALAVEGPTLRGGGVTRGRGGGLCLLTMEVMRDPDIAHVFASANGNIFQWFALETGRAR
jgi:hypothetical protein